MSASVVPARAGMSPANHASAAVCVSGPRASGDEPEWVDQATGEKRWSPRERG